jgi:CheY-like chemotaxis protein
VTRSKGWFDNGNAGHSRTRFIRRRPRRRACVDDAHAGARGLSSDSVETGAGCLELAQRSGRRFDLYLLNRTFLDASGVSLCAALRQFDPATPIIFYSSRAMPQEREAALEAGAREYLVKPNDLFNVTQHVARWIDPNRRPPQANPA